MAKLWPRVIPIHFYSVGSEIQPVTPMQPDSVPVYPVGLVAYVAKPCTLQGFLCFDSMCGAIQVNLSVLGYPLRFHRSISSYFETKNGTIAKAIKPNSRLTIDIFSNYLMKRIKGFAHHILKVLSSDKRFKL